MKKWLWNGFTIRFIEQKETYWAILDDVCNAINISPVWAEHVLDIEFLCRVEPSISECGGMLAVNELGIYELIQASNDLEARNFKIWSNRILQKMRNRIGLKPYEVMRMMEPEIQEQIDNMLDSLYWDDEKKCLMQSITLQGGDVEQVPF